MPIYEYRCEACGHTLDALQKVSDAPLTDCPECSAVALKRLISAPNFRLKGGGWYETDFKSDKERKRNLAESGGKESADKGDKSDKTEKSDKSAKSDSGEKKSGASPAPAAGKEAKASTKSKGSGTEAA